MMRGPNPKKAFSMNPYNPFNLSNCQIDLILQITSIYETSTPTFNYGICTSLADGHGYSAGIIQFTTGAGSAILVIQKYTEFELAHSIKLAVNTRLFSITMPMF